MFRLSQKPRARKVQLHYEGHPVDEPQEAAAAKTGLVMMQDGAEGGAMGADNNRFVPLLLQDLRR